MTYLAPPLNPPPDNARFRSSNQRVATTAVACVLAALAIGTRNLQTTSAPSQTAAHQNVADVRIVDPAFCRDQTWPYIDQRCLKRSPPQQTASTQPENISPPINIAPQTANTAPRDVMQSASSTERNAPSPIVAESPVPSPQPVPAESSTASPAPTDPAKVYSTTQTAFIDDSPAVKPAPKPHHGRHHSGFFFGFRF
jgi:hypothetical protein